MIGSATEEGTVALGRVRFRDDQRLVMLALEDRRRHLYIVGKTGMGKTTLIQNMLAEDIAAGRGVGDAAAVRAGEPADRVATGYPDARVSPLRTHAQQNLPYRYNAPLTNYPSPCRHHPPHLSPPLRPVGRRPASNKRPVVRQPPLTFTDSADPTSTRALCSIIGQ